MEILAALEERVERVIEAYRTLAARLADLEEENRTLKSGGEQAGQLDKRVAELEGERAHLRERIERLVKQLAEIEK